MPTFFPKLKPTHYRLAEIGSWLDWPYQHVSVAALMKNPVRQTKTIQGIAVYALCGGLRSAGTYWRWDCVNGFTDGEYSNGPSTK